MSITEDSFLAVNPISLKVLAHYIFYRNGGVKIVFSLLVNFATCTINFLKIQPHMNIIHTISRLLYVRGAVSSLISWKHRIIRLLNWKGTNSTKNNRIIAHHRNVYLDSGFIVKFRNYSECCFTFFYLGLYEDKEEACTGKVNCSTAGLA